MHLNIIYIHPFLDISKKHSRIFHALFDTYSSF